MPSLDRPAHAALLIRITDAASNRGHLISGWEQQFSKNIRKYADSRHDSVEITGEPWNPSVKQWNQLTEIGDKLGVDR